MKPFKEILITSYDGYQPMLWHNVPLQQYYPRIKGYLSAKLAKEYAGLFAAPKITLGKEGKKIIIWSSDELTKPSTSLKSWIDEHPETPFHEPSSKVKQQLTAHINQLLGSMDASERTWGEMLSLCLKNLKDDFIFIEEEKVVIAGWGLQALEAGDVSSFSAFKATPKPAVDPSNHTSAKSDFLSTNTDDVPDDASEKGDQSTLRPFSENEENQVQEDIRSIQEPDATEGSQEVEDFTSNTEKEPEFSQAESFSSPGSNGASTESINEQHNIPPSLTSANDEFSTTSTHSEKTVSTEGLEPDHSNQTKEFSESDQGGGNNLPPQKNRGFFSFFRRWWWLLLLLLLLALLLWRTCSSNSATSVLPDNPNVIVPIDSADIIVDDDSLRMIVADRLNIALSGTYTDIKAFSKAFKTAYPDPNYTIIYYDTLTKRIQIQIPANQRELLIQKLPNTLPDFDMIIWHESIFSRNKLPTDPGFQDPSISWYIDAIKASGAWDQSFGDKKIVVAIIDDGFDLQHPEFASKIVSPWNVINRNRNVFSNQKLTHGTHVAGSAIANKNNGTGISGIAPNCSFMPVQIADATGVMSSTAIIDGILYAINQGADVINLSLGMHIEPIVATYPLHVQREIIANYGKSEEKFWDQIFSIADKNGVTVILAGGNNNVMIGIDPMQRSPYTINVAALTPELQKADFSNFGEFTTLSAPGVGIYSSIPNGRYQFMDGTSMAAPIVTGAVALIKSMRPNLTPRQIKNLLVNTGAFVSNELGPLLQLASAMASIDDPNAIADPDDIDCESIQLKIDSLLQEVERLKGLCPDAVAPDTMEMPEVIENLDFTIGRWKSTTSITNDKGGAVTLYFDFFPNHRGELTLVEPNGLECNAPLSLQANQRAFNVNQLQEAMCAQNQGTYSKYIFSCQADARGQAECTAQNKTVRANRFSFKLVKIN